MIKFFYNLSPNPMKVALFLEEAGLDYEPVPVDTRRGEQFDPDYLAINPNAKVPAIIDGDATVFDSNAILLYLAEKTGKFLPAGGDAARGEMLSWLMFVATGVGPFSGQAVHFRHFAPEKVPYAIDRYTRETARLYGVLDKRLADREFIAGTYSIADIASYPWIVPHERQGQNLDDFPHLKRWFEAIRTRPAVVRAYEKAKEINTDSTMTEEAKRILFGQTAAKLGLAGAAGR